MAKFFFWSQSGDSLFLAMRLAREGHDVQFYVKDPSAKDIGRGLVRKVDAKQPPRGSIVVFDMVGNGPVADAYKRQGYKVLGGSGFADQLELDRKAGTEWMRAAGIGTPETHLFKGLNEGLAFADKHEGAWYYKPSGNQAAGMTYGARDAADLKRFLNYAFEKFPPKAYELQKRVSGVELSHEGWWDGRNWVPPFNSTFEDKKFMAGNKGPNVGCAANVVWRYHGEPLVFLKTLKRISTRLEQTSYVGPIDLNMIINDEGEPCGLEWSPRFGYDALTALCMLIKGDLGEQLALFAHGQLKQFELEDELALTVNVSIPPFPSWEYAKKEVEGMPVDPMLLRDPTRIFPKDIMLNKRYEPVIAGTDGVVCVVGDVGKKMPRLREEVLKRVETLNIPNAQYRIDPVDRAERDWAVLERLKYEVPSYA